MVLEHQEQRGHDSRCSGRFKSTLGICHPGFRPYFARQLYSNSTLYLNYRTLRKLTFKNSIVVATTA